MKRNNDVRSPEKFTRASQGIGGRPPFLRTSFYFYFWFWVSITNNEREDEKIDHHLDDGVNRVLSQRKSTLPGMPRQDPEGIDPYMCQKWGTDEPQCE